jgi:hypothetical protein
MKDTPADATGAEAQQPTQDAADAGDLAVQQQQHGGCRANQHSAGQRRPGGEMAPINH